MWGKSQVTYRNTAYYYYTHTNNENFVPGLRPHYTIILLCRDALKLSQTHVQAYSHPKQAFTGLFENRTHYRQLIIIIVKRAVVTLPFVSRMLGGVGGRHASVRRRGSSPGVRRITAGVGAGADSPPSSPRPMRRRRAAVAASDQKTCALVHTRLKLGDIMWVLFDSSAKSRPNVEFAVQ